MMQPSDQKVSLVFSPITSAPRFVFTILHNPLAAFAPPHHKGRHEEGDQDGHHDEGTQDAVWWVPEKPSGQRAIVEVVLVDPDEELIH